MARKSLGTLTLDLIAKVSGFEQGMDKASRKSQKTAKKIERHANQIGAAVAVGTAAAVTGLTALVASTTESAREIQNLSRLAGSSPQEFQKLTYAAGRYGIEQEKVSDILKDTNDRIGDFIQTGGGPMADFFENIAPKVGVTADEFARLSGPDALQLYVQSLEEAGVSQKDMTFYMEAIASDATALVPLLRDNGREMKNLGDEAERTGNVFSDLEFEQLEDIRRGFDELSGAATGMKNEIVLAALPAVNDLIDLLSDESTLNSARALGKAIITSMNFVIEAIDGAVKVTQFLAEEMAAFIHGPAFDDIPRLTEQFEDQTEAMREQESILKNLRRAQENSFTRIRPEDLAQQEQKLERLKQERQATLDLIEAERKRQEELASQRSAAGTGVGTVDLPPVVNGRGTNTPGEPRNGSTPAEPPVEDPEEDYQQRVAAIRQSFESEKQIALRLYGERNEEINELYQADAISKMEADHLKIQSEQEMQDRLTQIRRSAADEDARLQQQRQALILAGTESLFGSLADITGEFAGEQSALYKTMFAVQKAAAIAQSIVAINTGIAQAAAVPWPANLAAMASVATATAGIVGNIQSVSVAGMAHDGIDSIPSEGTWLLDKDERVLSSPQADKLDAFLASQQGGGGGSNISVNLHEDASKAGQVEQRQRPDGGTDVNVFVADIFEGGKRSKALESVYGLRRQGR